MQTDRPTWHSRAWTVALVLIAVIALMLTTTGFGDEASVGAALAAAAATAVLVVAWAVTRTRAQRRRFEEQLAAWAAERAAHAERLRIARDLHDLSSHGLGLITLRAAAARSVAGPDGDAERADALAHIEDASRQATIELRRMLAVLRAPDPAPLHPADTLEGLPAIVDAVRGTGLQVTLDVDQVGAVTPGVQLTVCAVVREALGNTIRHAGPTQAHVQVRREGTAVLVRVQDAGPGDGWSAQPGAGHGLVGLRERVAVVGGTLDVASDGGGWTLTACIPDGGRT